MHALAVVDLSTYVTAISDVISGISSQVPTMATAALAVGAGVIVVMLGVKLLKKFAKG